MSVPKLKDWLKSRGSIPLDYMDLRPNTYLTIEGFYNNETAWFICTAPEAIFALPLSGLKKLHAQLKKGNRDLGIFFNLEEDMDICLLHWLDSIGLDANETT